MNKYFLFSKKLNWILLFRTFSIMYVYFLLNSYKNENLVIYKMRIYHIAILIVDMNN